MKNKENGMSDADAYYSLPDEREAYSFGPSSNTYAQIFANNKVNYSEFIMKKLILIIFLFFILYPLTSEPIDIFNLEPREKNELFDNLSMQDQYESILLTFKDKTKGLPIPYESKWAGRIVERFGREILPLINMTLKTYELDSEFREPVNRKISLTGQFFFKLNEKKLLTEQEIELYTIIINEKIDRYILKYRVIDSSVNYGFFVLLSLGSKTPTWGNIENIAKIRDSYEQKLGVTGIAIGKDIFEHIVPSPLTEYITD